jgi:predicted nucleic acid-binding protein
MPVKAFLDTNVLIYALSENDPRCLRAEELLTAGGVLSVQVLNEFASVARKKLSMSWAEIAEAIEAFLVLCPTVLPITVELHGAARDIAEKRGYGIYDGLVIAAALEAGCSVLYSEDLQDGQRMGDHLTIRNPFNVER